MSKKSRIVTAKILSFLLILFSLRVTGQLLVVLGAASFLPPMDEWYSGAISYPLLLVMQVILILVLSAICISLFKNRGIFAKKNTIVGSALFHGGRVYFLLMLFRYVLRMSLYPHERWFGGSIPIFFHLILASFVLTYAWYLKRAPVLKSSYKKMPIRKTLWFIAFYAVVFIGCIGWLIWQLLPFVVSYMFQVRAPEFAVRDRKVMTSMRDGITLRSQIFSPSRLEKSPTILVRLPLYESPTNTLFASLVGRFWASHGYTVVVQGVRGYFGSGGTFEPFIYERNDGIDTLSWIRKQDWYNGYLGMWGGSYFGYTEYAIADQLNPKTSTLMVQIASTNPYDFFYPGKAYSYAGALYWALRSADIHDNAPDYNTVQKGLMGKPIVKADDRVGKSIDFFDSWSKNVNRDDAYWQKIDTAKYLKNTHIPIHFMAGWLDPFLPSELKDYEEVIKTSPESHLIIGPWKHAVTLELPGNIVPDTYRLESLRYTIPWFDEHLLHISQKTNEPPVRLYVMGNNSWRDEASWPLRQTVMTKFFLSGSGDLSPVQKSEIPVSRTFVYNPLHPVRTEGGSTLGYYSGITKQSDKKGSADVLTYSTQPFPEDVEITGATSVVLYVSTDATNTDFTAKLVDVFPDGTSYNITDGIIRSTYLPNIPTRIKIALWPTSIVLPAGHRLRMEIASSNFPRYDANPNTGNFIPAETQSIPARQTVYNSSVYPSYLLLPIIKR